MAALKTKVIFNLLWVFITYNIYMISAQAVMSNFTFEKNPVATIFTEPFIGTCGETNQTIQIPGNNKYQCQYDCPSVSRTYPKNQEKTISKMYLINSSRTFWNDGCVKVGVSQNVPVGQLQSDKNCYIYNEVITSYKRSTHALWIKPQLGGIKGTVLSIGQKRSGFNSFSLGIQNNQVLYGYGFGESYLYNNSYIPDNQWSHLAVQVNYRNGFTPECSIFINGMFLTPSTDSFVSVPSRKKRDSPVLQLSNDLLLSVGVDSDIYDTIEFLTYEPLNVTECINIGYSSSVRVRCLHDGSCSDINYRTQEGLQNSVFQMDHSNSIYSCNYDSDILTLFACSWFLPAKGSNIFLGFSPCKSFCTEIIDKCGSEYATMLGINSSVCASPPNCVTADYKPEYGIYKGEIRNYVIYSEILTNREIEVLVNPSNELPKVNGLSNCLCPPNFPAINPSNDFDCLQNNHNQVRSEHRLGSNFSNYHVPEYAIDGNLLTTWISIPGNKDVALDMVFNEALQVLQVNITSKNKQLPGQIDLYLMERVSNKAYWQHVAVLTSNITVCNKSYPINRARDIGCYVYTDILNVNGELIVNLLQGRENWYNTTYMNVDLFHFLRGEGLKIRFKGFPLNSSRMYHEVNEIEIGSRKFSGNILCGCYAPGTDDNAQCDGSTNQCPCLTQTGDPSKAGLKCEPYAMSITPAFGPESGGSTVTIKGGYFGNDRPVIEGRFGNLVVEFAATGGNETVIIAKTVNVTLRSNLILDNPLQLVIKLLNGHVIQTELTFTYMEDPTITNVYPLESFLRGGIQQTVVGNNFQSVYQPLMTVSVKDVTSENAAYINKTTHCTILNNTIMMCPSPDFSQEIAQGIIKGLRKKRDVHHDENIVQLNQISDGLLQRQRRQTTTEFTNALNSPVREFYIGFVLDGVRRYENVSEELGPSKGVIKIFYNPAIDKWDSVLVFSPYKGDKFAHINGQKMDYGCNLQDYNVSIGDGQGDNVELLSNQLVIMPPVNPPDLGDYHRNGNHRVVCTVGNIKATIGYMEYRTGPLDDPAILAAVIVCCIIAAIIIILVVAFFAAWKYNGESPYQSLKRKNVSSKNPYVSHVGGQVSAAAVPVFNMMEQLKVQNMPLYQNVMKVRIDAQRMHVGDQIGKGNFGTVHIGTFSATSGQKKVAIKTLKGGSSNSIREFEEFLDEATIMIDFDHENVLSLHGVVIMQNKPYVVLPLMDLGDLRGYVASSENHFSVGELLKYGRQIAAGMTYLSGLKFVHRDLAARNCMVNSDKVVKIADFGLARDIYEKDYYAVEDRKRPLPVKWMAIECLDTFKFSTKSDVWSYAVTLWELLMRGTKPYPDIDNIDMKRALLLGKRLEQPIYCPDSIFILMQDCWKVEPKERPDFKGIVNRIDTFFIEVTQFEENPSYEGRPAATASNTAKGIPEYLEMSEMNTGPTDDYHSYLPITTDVPLDMPTRAGWNNNMGNEDRYVERLGIAPDRPSDRYSRDPTGNVEGEAGYITPISTENSTKNYSRLNPATKIMADESDGYTGDRSPGSPTSPGYLQPVSLSQKEKSGQGSETTDGYVNPTSIDVNLRQ